MTLPQAPAAAVPELPAVPVRPARWRRSLPWAALVALLAVAQSLLVWLTANYESTRAQEDVEATSATLAVEIRQLGVRDLQALQALPWNDSPTARWQEGATALMRQRPELLRIERRDARLRIVEAVDTPLQPPLFRRLRRDEIELETQLACGAALRRAGPLYSHSYFVPMPDGLGAEVTDLCIPLQREGRLDGYVAATLSLAHVLSEAVGPAPLRQHEISFVEGDSTRLARAGALRGAGVYVSDRVVDLPGLALQLRVDSIAGGPRLIPTLSVALVLGMSLGLAALVMLLVRDVRLRATAERALAESLAFRKAMEDSLVTGLRARDLEGRITYVNPAFCQMVGFAPNELLGRRTPPYWPPELADEYAQRQGIRLGTPAARETALDNARSGLESTFQRKNGERFAALIFEAPLVDGAGRHTGWMSAVLDVSERRRMEELSRQQQERLQATARLATVGEMASLLSHELNQPLAAIASYATGSLNLMAEGAPDAETLRMLQQAAQRIAEQAERAGRVIRSVHDFVRRRDQAREAIGADMLFDAVMPLVRLQARKSGTRIDVDLPRPAPRVLCDRTMVEQVLLNLTRNGMQAMESVGEVGDRVLTLSARQTHERWVAFTVTDRGPGIAPEVAQRLFTPFFTTRSEGMGLGLSLCRTVIEQHGGALDFRNLRDDPQSSGQGTEFRFTLPADSAERHRRPPAAPAPPVEPESAHEPADDPELAAEPRAADRLPGR